MSKKINYNEFFDGLNAGTSLIIDSCFAFNDSFEEFMEALNAYSLPHFTTYIPVDVYLETTKKLVSTNYNMTEEENEETRMKAIRALYNMQMGIEKNTLQLMKEYQACSFFADPTIIGATLAMSPTSDVIVLTQDVNLMRAIRELHEFRAVKGGNIDVYKLHWMSGGVCEFEDYIKKFDNCVSNTISEVEMERTA